MKVVHVFEPAGKLAPLRCTRRGKPNQATQHLLLVVGGALIICSYLVSL